MFQTAKDVDNINNEKAYKTSTLSAQTWFKKKRECKTLRSTTLIKISVSDCRQSKIFGDMSVNIVIPAKN